MIGIFPIFSTTRMMARQKRTTAKRAEMNKASISIFAAAVAVGGAAMWASYAMAQTSSGPFTEAQAQAGQPIYVSRCASCHDAGGETARLMGPAFTQGWKSR